MTREQSDGPRLTLPPIPGDQRHHEVAAWRESVLIDTYAPADPDPYPAFLENRVYQGSSGRVYPLPFYERVAARSEPMRWDAVHLENRWLRVMVLPALGGRIHVGFDKVAGYDFFYRSNVIKPALVGLAGPWASGGVEFNWPQHHRPGTFLPVDVEIEREPDGAITVWCSDHDPFTRMKGMHGVRLGPDRAVLELRVRLYNRTEDVQTFLWWANAAVRVHDDYQSFFPPDVRFVADHARRATTAYPRASSRYYGVDYPARVSAGRPDADRLDWHRNIPVPTSFMCLGSTEDFFGGYDHRAEAGFVHWADHRVAPGKKQWTWGNAPFGQAWERNLTDGDGPYIELMAGVYTDNQPDFSYLAPGETKAFSQYWYPIQRIGPPQRATLDAAISLATETGAGGTLVRVGAAVTAPRPGCLVVLRDADQRVVWSMEADLAPGSPLVEKVRLDGRYAGPELELAVEQVGITLARWRPGIEPAGPGERPEPPEPASEPPAPEQLASADELYLTGLHLEQYRHATRSPEPYWQEALRRDPGDARCNLALAARRYRAADHAEAERLLRRAVARLTRRNPNPYDGEAHYRLGLTLTRMNRLDEASDALAKATWNAAWRAPAHHALARLHCRAGRWTAALGDLERALAADTGLLQARDLRVLVLRRLGRTAEADAQARAGRALDPLDWWARDLAGEPLDCDTATCLDVALDYAGAGFTAEALRVLDRAEQRLSEEGGYARSSEDDGQAPGDGVPDWGRPRSGLGPLIGYHRAALLAALGDHDGAQRALRAARAGDSAYCFPHRLDDHAVLSRALDHDPGDARAASLLGHWLYHHRRHPDAIAAWSRAVAGEPGDIVAWRNLGIAAFNIEGDPERAAACYERALALAPGDARLWYERDQLAGRTGEPPAVRLSRLDSHPHLITARDDLTIAYVLLLLVTGRAEHALKALTGRRFQPWEGGEGQVLAAWEQTRLALSRAALADGRPAEAQAHAEAALDPPENLGETRHPLAYRGDLHLMLGDACAANGRHDAAAQQWTMAATAEGDFRQMSPQPFSEMTWYSALAWRRLGHPDRAGRLIDGLAAHLSELRSTPARIDYFTTSLPTMLLFDDDLQARQDTLAEFLAAQLAALRGRRDSALAHLTVVLARDPAHLPAHALRTELAGEAT
ncbi:MAG: Tetratricopeptide repeat protein [Streptosporangiaceae bacterium]|jgi:tetratricopeptide (TPR) repeat protein|nr:Tetratricopeptide repeat protein [Streptosporangiaceae bacterium]